MQYSAWQLSAEHRPPTLQRSPRRTLMRTGVAQPDPTLPHGHLVLVGPYDPTPITPKGKQDNKNQTPLKYPHPTRNFGPNELTKNCCSSHSCKTTEGKIEHGSDIVTGEGVATRNTRTCPDRGSATAEHNVSIGAPSHLLMEPGWDTLQPGGWAGGLCLG